MKKKYFGLRSKIVKLFFLLLVLLLGLGVAAFVTKSPPSKSNDISNEFDQCQCVSLAYDAAAVPIKQLIRWTQGTSFDDHPAPPGWVSWNAYEWADNILKYGPMFDPTLDWAGAIDHNPSPGAIVVFPAKYHTTWWTVNATQAFWDLSEFGHIAVVKSYDSQANTINTNDRNWGEKPVCGSSSERKKVDVYLEMLFIHSPARLTPPNTDPTETKLTYKTQFDAKLPWRNIWVASRSRFELFIDGKSILKQDRPEKWYFFTKSNYQLDSPNPHTVVIDWWKIGNDPTPEFSQTWWPSVMTFGAEAPDPPDAMEVNYTYFVKPQPLLKGQTASIAIVAQSDLPFEIASVDVSAGSNKLGSIQGSYGMFSIQTDSLPTGHSQLNLTANVPDWKGTINSQLVDIQVVEPPGYVHSTSTPIATLTPEPVTPEPPAQVSKLRGTVLEHSACKYGPDTAYLYKYGILPGTTMQAIGRDADGDWLQVQAIGGHNPCWLKASLMKVDGDIMALPDAWPYANGLPISPYFERITILSASGGGSGRASVEWNPHKVRADLDTLQGIEYVIEVWTCVNGKPAFYALGFAPGVTSGTFQVDNSCGVPTRADILGEDKEGFSLPVNIPIQ